MPSASDLKAELRQLRKESVRPVSRMRVADIATEIQRLKGVREETPLPAATPSAPPKRAKASVESIKEAKASEFPTQPDSSANAKETSIKKSATQHKSIGSAKAPKNIVPDAVEGQKAKLAKLLELLS